MTRYQVAQRKRLPIDVPNRTPGTDTCRADPCVICRVVHAYLPLDVQVRTPHLILVGTTDELLERLIPIARAGVVGPGPLPVDDPMSHYEGAHMLRLRKRAIVRE